MRYIWSSASLSLPICCAALSILTSRDLVQQCFEEDLVLISKYQCSLHGSLERSLEEDSAPSIVHEDGEADLQHWPWSYPPVCTDYIENLQNKLCVYTNTSFSGGRGISLFSTPEVAKQFSELPAFHDYETLNDAQVNKPQDSWYVTELPGRGKGGLAKRKLKRGDRVAAFTPALVAYRENILSTPYREKYFRLAIDQLPKPTRDGYLGLAVAYGLPDYVTQDVAKANNFQIDVASHPHIALFPESSRLNHDCGPNAQYWIDPELLTQFIHVTRPIAKDEELSISYTPPLELTETRQAHVTSGFLFTCTCLRCSSASKTDAIVQEIKSVEEKLGEWSSADDAVKIAERMLELHEKEGMEGFLDLPYGHLALAHNSMGKAKEAIKYAKLAIEAIRWKDGKWTPNLQMWEDLIADPKKHFSWRYRKS